ncbi:unnamed protein product [Musa hybrid cultivar]
MSWVTFATCRQREKMEDTHFMLPHRCSSCQVFFLNTARIYMKL